MYIYVSDRVADSGFILVNVALTLLAPFDVHFTDYLVILVISINSTAFFYYSLPEIGARGELLCAGHGTPSMTSWVCR